MTLLTEKQVAGMMNISVFTLQKARRTGGFIPFMKVKNKVLYDQADIEAYLKERKFHSTSEY
ncbi:MAG: helix-turn-helix domain-containing protein [Alphaproteobacteria bacterium]|jgi:hypothetical protein|nr:helix-turn-helix domain-containing protein [Alphaproteobacteria bacterium]